ncbi:hypothetical protein MD484_g7310, partial [Candolleomyces efflorescens]
MDSQRFPYPSQLESDDEGSIGSDWDQVDDDSDVAYHPQPRKAGAASGTPPHRHPCYQVKLNGAASSRSSHGYVTVPACVVVENKFKSGWVTGTPVTITKIFKVVENDTFLKPYDAYRQRVGPKENYLYHGTKRECKLGVSTTTLCASATCAICNILKTSYKVEVARQGTFGQGIYGSTASNTYAQWHF